MTDPIRLHQPWPEDLARRYREAGHWRGETFGAWLRERAQAHPDRIAVVCEGERISYADLDRQASAIAAGLLARGLRRGDRVIVHLPNLPEFISAIFGMFRVGIIPLYALPAHRIAEIAHFADTGDARGYICAGDWGGFDYRNLASELQTRCPQVRHVIVTRGDAGSFTPLAELMRAEQAQSPDAATLPAIDVQGDLLL